MPSFITRDYNFADCYPHLVKYWDHQANHPISPRLLPNLIKNNIIHFTTQEGYSINFKAKKLTKLLYIAKSQILEKTQLL